MRLVLVVIVFLIQACSTATHVRLYQGPDIGEANEAQLILPLNFELLTLDGETVSQFNQTFRNHDLHIKLAPGFHTLVMRYSDIWQIDAENHDKLTSGQFTFTGTFAAQEIFKIQTPPITTYLQAQNFVASPSINLVSQSKVLPGSHLEKRDPLKFSEDDNIEQVTYPNLKQMKFWWAQASQYERNEFKQWLSNTAQ